MQSSVGNLLGAESKEQQVRRINRRQYEERLACGNTGVQMAGWFNREITSVDDLKGLKMRIPGLGGEVMARLGAVPVNIPGGEIFTSLQQGAIDAAEWVGPYNDLAFGLHRAAKYCYYPGWQEPGPTLECMVNKTAYESLPNDLKAILDACCRAINDDMLAEYTARNQDALKQLIEIHKVEFRRLPDPVLAALRCFRWRWPKPSGDRPAQRR